MAKKRLAPPQKVSAKVKLRLFVEAWMVNGGNATAAARPLYPRQGGHALEVTAGRLLRKAAESGLLEKRVQRVARAIGADEIIERLSDMARSDMADFITMIGAQAAPLQDGAQGPNPLPRDWWLDLDKAIAAKKTHLIHGLSYDKEGRPTIKLHDSRAALVDMARIRGLMTEGPRDTGLDVAVLLSAFASLPDSTLLALRDALRLAAATDVTPVTR